MKDALVFYKFIDDERFECEVFGNYFEDSQTRLQNPVALVLSATLRDAEAFRGFARLCALMNNLAKKAQKLGAVCVGLQKGEVSAKAFFYCRDIAAADAVESAPKAGFALIEGSAFSDPEWKIFQKDVRPTAAELQTIENEKLGAQYKKRGDDADIMRKVDHHLSFSDEVSLTGFALSAKNAGFALGNPHYNGDCPRPHGIFVHNITPINSQSINACTTKLVELAQSFGGAYDYWDCPVMKKQRL